MGALEFARETDRNCAGDDMNEVLVRYVLEEVAREHDAADRVIVGEHGDGGIGGEDLRGSLARRAPRPCQILAGPGERFQTWTSWPARSAEFAMPLPMAPSREIQLSWCVLVGGVCASRTATTLGVGVPAAETFCRSSASFREENPAAGETVRVPGNSLWHRPACGVYRSR